MKDGKEILVSLEVNPSLKNVDLYNANGKKVVLLRRLVKRQRRRVINRCGDGREAATKEGDGDQLIIFFM